MNDNFGRRRRPRWPWLRRAGALAAMAGMAMLAAACGGGGPSSTAGGSASPSSAYAKTLAYSQCMRSHGVPNFPDPNSNGDFSVQEGRNGVSKQTMLSAQHACRHLLPSGMHQGTAAQQQQRLNVALYYARCMRAHGFPNFPDPTADNSGIGFNTAGIPTASPQFKSADLLCQSQARSKVTGQPSAGSGS